MKKAVVQIYIDDNNIPALDVDKQNMRLIQDSIQGFQQYADKHGADYFLFTERYFKNPEVHPQNEIFRVLDLDYDLILTADVDVVVNRPDEDIFAVSCPKWLTAAYRPGMDPNINSGVLVWAPGGRAFTKTWLDLGHAETLKNRDQDHLQEIWGHEFHYIDDLWNDYLFRDEGIFHHYKAKLKSQYRSERYENGVR